MKKIICMLMALLLIMAFVACNDNEQVEEPNNEQVEEPNNEQVEEPNNEEIELPEETYTVLTHDEYMAAELNSEVVIETYVQSHQSWWDNKITVYAQSPDGAYFLYELECSEEDAAKLLPGTQIRVKGYKGEWSGEIEVMDGTFEFTNSGATFIAEAFDATALLGTDELIKHQNEFVSFTDMTVEKVEYKNGEAGDDIYVTLSKDGASYDFCVEVYLTGPDTEVYKTVGTLEAGNVVDIQGYLYWYEGANTHITSITVK